MSQYCQAHTILKKFSSQYANFPVLVLGGQNDTVRNVAKGSVGYYIFISLGLSSFAFNHRYGYQKAYTTLDVLAWNPS